MPLLMELHPDAWWSTSSIALWLDYSVSRVEAKVVNLPGFPEPEHFWEGAHPRWKAGEVMAFWARHLAALRARRQTLGNRSSGNLDPDAQPLEQDQESRAA